MNYDKNSFLVGISVGTQLKGWATASVIKEVDSGNGGGSTGGGGVIEGEGIPAGCGQIHGVNLLNFDTLVTCITDQWNGRVPQGCGKNHGLRLLDFGGLVDSVIVRPDGYNFSYNYPACDYLDGNKVLDYTLLDVNIIYTLLGGYYTDANK